MDSANDLHAADHLTERGESLTVGIARTAEVEVQPRGTIPAVGPRIDNRSDARLYGELFNWATRFNIVGGDYALGDWTLLGETGWGTTAIQTRRGRFSSEIRASYLLVSRRIGKLRARVRADEFKAGDDQDYAFTGALLWDAHPRLRAAAEAISSDGEERLALEMRYRF